MIGPLQQHHRTCVSGQVCSFGGIEGQHLSLQNRVLVLETCASEVLQVGFPSAGYVTGVFASGGSVSWGNTRLSAAGGQYRLCWCDANASPCSLPRSFATDFGSLTVVGVSPLEQTRTCVSGQHCSVQGLTGHHLSRGDSWMAMDTCGELTFIPRFAFAGFSYEVSASGSFITWGPVAPTAAGGQYRLCWCSAGFECLSGEDFVVDAGSLVLLGINPITQDRTCVSGHTCFLGGLQGIFPDINTDIAQQSSLLVLDTCGLPSSIARFSDAGLLSQVSSSSIGGSTAYEATVAITTAGGMYRLCWCTGLGLCDIPENYQVDIGTLFVLGPSPLSQEWTCISGQTCRLYGINGQGLQDTHQFAVLDTCGTGSVPDRFPSAGILHADLSASGELVLSFGAESITAASSEYRLCWCSSLDSTFCTRGDFASTDFGKLTILGPGPLHQDMTCISGQTCRLSGVFGAGMMSGDSFIVQDTCGLADSLPGFPHTGLVTLTDQASTAVEWSNTPVTSAGGLYRLCWCSELAPMGCSSAREFVVDVGSLTLLGVSLEQSKTCISGMTCEVSFLHGEDHGVEHVVLIANTCGVSEGSALPLLPSSGLSSGSLPSGRAAWTVPLTAPGGDYRLCWCRGDHPTGGVDAWRCSQASDFLDMGHLLLIGPSPLSQDRTCVSGQSCEFDGFMGSYPYEHDRVLLAETCGIAGRDLSQSMEVALVGSVNASAETAAAFGEGGRGLRRAVVTWATPLQIPGGFYRLCWCSGQADLVSPCQTAESFRTDMGSLTMLGVAPLDQHRTCISGLPCAFAISGLHMSASDQFIVLQTCGVSATIEFQAAFHVEHSNPGSLSLVSQPPWTKAAGRVYSLCWCPGPETWAEQAICRSSGC